MQPLTNRFFPLCITLERFKEVSLALSKLITSKIKLKNHNTHRLIEVGDGP